jgi:hypothetical protein
MSRNTDTGYAGLDAKINRSLNLFGILEINIFVFLVLVLIVGLSSCGP